MIYELAEFENPPTTAPSPKTRSTQRFSVSPGEPDRAHAHLAEVDGRIAAAALWFYSFSTWDGVAGIYRRRPLRPARGFAAAGWPGRCCRDAGRSECVDAGYTRLSWAVLDWNVDAIALYDSVGARP